MMKRLRRLRGVGNDRGVNMIEAAIITPLLLFLTFAIVDFSALTYVYLALENGVSQATRFGITGATSTGPSGPMTRAESIIAKMRDATPTLTIPDDAFVFTHMPPGSTGWAGGVGGPGSIQRVQVNYTWTLYTPFMRPLFPGGQVNISVSSTMKTESYTP
jgi:Flp pilus assembly protein TadG